MCNCGKKREGFSGGLSSGLKNYKNIESPQHKVWDDVYFEYTGLTALSVTGKVSGKHYRFMHAGNIQPIDYRDASGMMGVPVLRKVSKQ